MHIRSVSIAVIALTAGAAHAVPVRVTIENTQPTGGFAFTPFWLGFHDNSFDVFDVGATAAGGLVEIAELGDTGPLSTRFGSEQPAGEQTTLIQPDGAPVFSPGESASQLFDLDPGTQGWFNYASMLVPSNDLFVGNSSAIQLFDGGGSLLAPQVIEIFGINVYDAGSEVNDLLDGGAFVQGVDATQGTAEGGVIALFLSSAGAQDYLDSIDGTTTANGDTVTLGFEGATLLGRITIVPSPGAATFLGLAGLASLRRRRCASA